MSCHVMSCHVMSCHVMSCRHYCIEFLKKSFSKTFLFLKIIYKYFACFLACIYTDCHAIARNDAIICSHYEAIYSRSNPLYLDCHASLCSARNDNKIKACINAICSNYKSFQFDKFQRVLSVIYKKIYY